MKPVTKALLLAALFAYSLLGFSAEPLSTQPDAGPSDSEFWHRHQGDAMGTLIRVEFWLEDKARAKRLVKGVMAEMHRIDRLMSPYIESSELAQINARAHQEPVKVSPELFNLIKLALQHGQWSKGTFDITFASVGFRYDYRKGVKPDENQLADAINLVDYRSVRLSDDSREIRFLKAGMKIDLGGIAKGHAVDNAIRYLYGEGVRHGIVSAGGDSRIIGDRHGRPWILGIKNPRGDNHLISLPLEEVSVSTSGDYERYFIDQQGIRHHHIINPRSGKSASSVRSVTILGPNATMTDALSTTVFVMGVREGLEYINRLPDVSAIIIDSEGKLHYSNDLVRPTKTNEP